MLSRTLEWSKKIILAAPRAAVSLVRFAVQHRKTILTSLLFLSAPRVTASRESIPPEELETLYSPHIHRLRTTYPEPLFLNFSNIGIPIVQGQIASPHQDKLFTNYVNQLTTHQEMGVHGLILKYYLRLRESGPYGIEPTNAMRGLVTFIHEILVMIGLQLKKGASLAKVENLTGHNALGIALHTGDLDLMSVIISSDPTLLNMPTGAMQLEPFFLAVQQSKIPVIRLILQQRLQYSYDIFKKITHPESPYRDLNALGLAIIDGQEDVIRYFHQQGLLENFIKDMKDQFSEVLVETAAQKKQNSFDTLKSLGIDFNQINPPPLFSLFKNKSNALRLKTLKFLLNNGLNPTLEYNGTLALHYAIMQDATPKEITTLLAHKASMYKLDSRNNLTALELATILERFSAFKTLVLSGYNLDYINYVSELSFKVFLIKHVERMSHGFYQKIIQIETILAVIKNKKLIIELEELKAKQLKTKHVQDFIVTQVAQLGVEKNKAMIEQDIPAMKRIENQLKKYQDQLNEVYNEGKELTNKLRKMQASLPPLDPSLEKNTNNDLPNAPRVEPFNRNLYLSLSAFLISSVALYFIVKKILLERSRNKTQTQSLIVPTTRVIDETKPEEKKPIEHSVNVADREPSPQIMPLEKQELNKSKPKPTLKKQTDKKTREQKTKEIRDKLEENRLERKFKQDLTELERHLHALRADAKKNDEKIPSQRENKNKVTPPTLSAKKFPRATKNKAKNPAQSTPLCNTVLIDTAYHHACIIGDILLFKAPIECPEIKWIKHLALMYHLAQHALARKLILERRRRQQNADYEIVHSIRNVLLHYGTELSLEDVTLSAALISKQLPRAMNNLHPSYPLTEKKMQHLEKLHGENRTAIFLESLANTLPIFKIVQSENDIHPKVCSDWMKFILIPCLNQIYALPSENPFLQTLKMDALGMLLTLCGEYLFFINPISNKKIKHFAECCKGLRCETGHEMEKIDERKILALCAKAHDISPAKADMGAKDFSLALRMRRDPLRSVVPGEKVGGPPRRTPPVLFAPVAPPAAVAPTPSPYPAESAKFQRG